MTYNCRHIHKTDRIRIKNISIVTHRHVHEMQSAAAAAAASGPLDTHTHTHGTPVASRHSHRRARVAASPPTQSRVLSRPSAVAAPAPAHGRAHQRQPDATTQDRAHVPPFTPAQPQPARLCPATKSMATACLPLWGTCSLTNKHPDTPTHSHAHTLNWDVELFSAPTAIACPSIVCDGQSDGLSARHVNHNKRSVSLYLSQGTDTVVDLHTRIESVPAPVVGWIRGRAAGAWFVRWRMRRRGAGGGGSGGRRVVVGVVHGVAET